MSTDTDEDDDGTVRRQPTITLIENDDGWWTARDEERGVTTQGKTRDDALDNLDEAVALHTGKIEPEIDTWEEEKAVLEDLGLDPEEVKAARDEHDGLPDFMQ